MELGLAHSLSRYKLKFSPDKIDTMIVQVGTSPFSSLTQMIINFLRRAILPSVQTQQNMICSENVLFNELL